MENGNGPERNVKWQGWRGKAQALGFALTGLAAATHSRLDWAVESSSFHLPCLVGRYRFGVAGTVRFARLLCLAEVPLDHWQGGGGAKCLRWPGLARPPPTSSVDRGCKEGLRSHSFRSQAE